MAEEKNVNININAKDLKKMKNRGWHGGGGGAVWFFGFIGGLIYFLSTATTFWLGVLGILKAIVWPAILVYYLFQFLKL